MHYYIKNKSFRVSKPKQEIYRPRTIYGVYRNIFKNLEGKIISLNQDRTRF